MIEAQIVNILREELIKLYGKSKGVFFVVSCWYIFCGTRRSDDWTTASLFICKS